MNLEDRIKEIESQVESLKQELKEEEESRYLPFPQNGVWYWYYDICGAVNSTSATDSRGRLNAYKTPEEAVKARDIAWAKKMVTDEIKRLNDGWVPDWKDTNQAKYAVSLESERLNWLIFNGAKCLPTYMYIKTRELAKQLIKSHEEDLLLILGEQNGMDNTTRRPVI